MRRDFILSLPLFVVAVSAFGDPATNAKSIGGSTAGINAGSLVRKEFGGKVQEVNARERWFFMNGGASKKYARIQVHYGPKTRWTGLPRSRKTPEVGDPLLVQVTLRRGLEFDALAIRLFDPNETPQSRGLKAPGK